MNDRGRSPTPRIRTTTSSLDATGQRHNISIVDEPIWTDAAVEDERLRLTPPLSPVLSDPNPDGG